MNLRKLPEHTIDIDLLPHAPLVLDVGCRDFQFDYEILALRPKAKIVAFDPDPEIDNPNDPRIHFMRAAVTEKLELYVEWQGPGEGAYIAGRLGDSGYGWPVSDRTKAATVENYNIVTIMNLYGNPFDVVKLDCEGSEFGILEHWPGPVATQISVEFHDFIDRNRWDDTYFAKLFAGPLKDYRVVLFELTEMGPTKSVGHWDSLLVKR